jgi:hypothetical protein
LFALHRRSVRDCRRCGDDDLRRRRHGPRQAGRRCLDVSVATCRPCRKLLHGNPPSSFTLQPGVLCGGCAVCRCQEWCNKRNALQAVSVLLDTKMFVQQAHCDMLRCNSFSSLQRWNRARRNAPQCCQGSLCGTTMWRQARLNAICCNGLHLRIIRCEWLHRSIFFMEVLRHVFHVAWLCCKTSAVHPLMLRFGVLSCTMMQHAVATCRSCAAGPSRGGRTASRASRCSSRSPRTSLRKRPSLTQT